MSRLGHFRLSAAPELSTPLLLRAETGTGSDEISRVGALPGSQPSPPPGPKIVGADRPHSAPSKIYENRLVEPLKIDLGLWPVVQPINLRCGEHPSAAFDRRGALSGLWQIVVCIHRLTQRRAVYRLTAVYECRWLSSIDVDFLFVAH